MTTGDWLGLVCLAGLVGFFAGGFFVWNLFFKHQVPVGPDEDDQDQEPKSPEVDSPQVEERGA